jgi:hypothetical protein
MLRRPASLLLRLAQRAPLAHAALSLCGALARGLHVFARAGVHEDFCEVEVRDGATASDLKKAVIAELQLGVLPNRVRLLREVESGGAPVPLDSRRALAEQGVLEGSSVVVEFLPSPAPPQPPALPQPVLTMDASPAATPHVEYRGA